MQNKDTVLSRLKHLLEVCKISRKGFKEASEHDIEPFLQNRLLQLSQNREMFIDQLTQQIEAYGGNPADSSSFTGQMMRAWMSFKDEMIGNNERALLDQCLKEEKNTLLEYKHTLAENDWSEHPKTMVQEQYLKIQQDYQQLEDMQKAL